MLMVNQGLLLDGLARDQAASSWDIIASIAHYLDSSWGLLWLFASTLKGGVSSAIGDRVLVTSCSTWIHSRLIYRFSIKELRDGCYTDLVGSS